MFYKKVTFANLADFPIWAKYSTSDLMDFATVVSTWYPCENSTCVFTRKDFETNQLMSKIEEEQCLGAQLQKKIKELQVEHSLHFTVFLHFFFALPGHPILKILSKHIWIGSKIISRTA